MALKTKRINGVELLAVGKWQGHNCPEGGCGFTTADLDAMVESYEATRDTFDAPVKLGHDDNQKLLQRDGYPAAGWVTNLRREGEKLLGDLVNVPGAVADLIAAGAYRKRSSEIRPEATVAGKKFKWLFTGLALIGADLPAVEGLGDITKLYHTMKFEGVEDNDRIFLIEADPEQVELADEDTSEVDDIIEELDRVIERAETVITRRKGAPALRGLVTTAKSELRRIARKQAQLSKDDDVDEKAIRKLLGIGDDDDITQAIKDLKAAKTTQHTEDDPAKTTKVEAETKPAPDAELSELRAEVIKLRQARETDQAKALVDAAVTAGKILPANHETSLKFALADPEGFTKFVDGLAPAVKLGEKGSATEGETGKVDLTKLEPTASQIAVAKQLGTWNDDHRLDLIRQNAAEQGVELPVDFGKKEESKA